MRRSNQIDGCQIWHGFPGLGFWNDDGSEIDVEQSPRAGGRYTITREAKWLTEDNDLDDSQKARLTTLLVDQRKMGVRFPKVTAELIAEARNAPALPVHERADRLLQFIARSSNVIGQSVSLFSHVDDETVPRDPFNRPVFPPDPTNPTFLKAMASTDSTTAEEVEYLVNYLNEMDWTKELFPSSSLLQGTVDGFSRISERQSSPNVSQVFVAMWFDESTNEALKEGIEPAIEERDISLCELTKRNISTRLTMKSLPGLSNQDSWWQTSPMGRMGHEAAFTTRQDSPTVLAFRLSSRAKKIL